MFLQDVWPKARIGLYCEWYRQESQSADCFDPEFPVTEQATAVQRLWLRNLNAALHVDMANAGITPTKFQLASYPKIWRDVTSAVLFMTGLIQILCAPILTQHWKLPAT